MIELRIDGKPLDLPQNFSIEIEDSSPIFNDRGSQSVPATVPATRRNIRLLKAAHRLDTNNDPNSPEQKADVVEGAYMRRGVLNLTEGGRREGFTFSIGFDNSTAYAKWQQKKLGELDNLPTYEPADQEGGYRIEWLLEELYKNYQSADPQKTDFAIFPVAINNEDAGEDEQKNKLIYWEILNVCNSDYRHFEQPTKVNRLLDGEVTEVSIPEGYCVSPFLRVWRVLELIFADLGVTINANPFKNDRELSRLVVLNNAADSVCLARIKYSDLMPDSTVEEFLNALWVRFGLVYNINYNTMTVNLRLMRDIINTRGTRPLDNWTSAPEKVIYEGRQYVKLSAKTSIEGAAPSHERLEDFLKGLDISKVHLGTHVSQWQNTGTRDEPKWDGDDSYYDWEENYDPDDYPEPPEPDWPEPDDDRDDGRDDYDYYSSRAAAPKAVAAAAADSRAAVTTKSDTFLAREFVTGQWYRLDATNGKVRLSSSSFFNWDPQPEGMTALELSADDEFVPIDRVNSVGRGTGHWFNDKAPLYLFGARHYHSYIKGSDETENSGDQTPLAFMFAYTIGGKTIGRLNAEGDDGKPIKLDDGTTPTISLLFQFKDGLFAKFWADYDEILRHGNRSVEVPTIINKIDLPLLDLLEVFTLKNIRCLIDTATYSLPSGRSVAVDLKLRTIQPHGKYNIKKEQNIPDFSAASRHLEWTLKSDGYTTALDTYEVRQQAATNYINAHQYEPHGTTGDYWYIGSAGAICRGSARLAPTWQSDTTLPTPTTSGQSNTRKYQARLTYDIYEIHDMATGPEEEDWELDETPIGQATATVEYTVELVARWVAD